MIQFDSRDKKFKSPYGAVPCGTAVSFRLLAQNCEEAFLITDTLGTFPMKKDGDFSASAPLRSLEEFGTLLRQITGIVSDIALRMKSGRADAKPLRTPRHDACKFCPMKAVCRIAGS